jgi:hypothetical protein
MTRIRKRKATAADVGVVIVRIKKKALRIDTESVCKNSRSKNNSKAVNPKSLMEKGRMRRNRSRSQVERAARSRDEVKRKWQVPRVPKKRNTSLSLSLSGERVSRLMLMNKRRRVCCFLILLFCCLVRPKKRRKRMRVRWEGGKRSLEHSQVCSLRPKRLWAQISGETKKQHTHS